MNAVSGTGRARSPGALRRFTLLLLPLGLLLGGCAGGHFHKVPGGSPGTVRYPLDAWPYRDYWTGLVFNGAKVGFSHLRLEVPEGGGAPAIRSEASLRFRFLLLDKSVNLLAYDRVGPDLSLQGFDYDYDLDGSRLAVQGEVRDGMLTFQVRSGGQVERRSLPLDGPVYPTGAIGLYPVLHGLAAGKRYEYRVFSGETQTVETVTQEVRGYETSELFEGAAFRVVTRLQGQEVTTWIDRQGRPVLEISMGGVVIAGLESEDRARGYVAAAALNKQDVLLDFSLIPSERPIPEPRRVRRMDILLEGVPQDLPIPGGLLQDCRQDAQGLRCRILSADRVGEAASPALASSGAAYLRPTLTVPSRHPAIVRLAGEIGEEAGDDAGRIRAILDWLRQNVQQEAVDAFSALDVLDSRKAECQGHTYLYAALARALGIPTRVVNGIVYAEPFGGFLYHTWAESRVAGRWVPVDPTFGQFPADATHVQLLEGESLAELTPLASLVGRLRVRVLAVEP